MDHAETMRLLKTMVNGQDTDWQKGTIRNADAVLLLLHSLGGMTARTNLVRSLREWRPGHRYGYLFQSESHYGGYGFVGRDEYSTHNTVHHSGHVDWDGKRGSKEHKSKRRTYYYRAQKGMYALTLEGLKRLVELGVTHHAVQSTIQST